MKINNISIEKIVVGYLETICYLVFDEQKNVLIIDPGSEADVIAKKIKELSLKPVGIINTHGHYDHIGANTELKSLFNIPIHIHKADAKYLTDSSLNGSVFFGLKGKAPEADVILENNSIIKLGPAEFKVIHTPGHTPGGICLLKDDIIFTGDTLFRGSVGRWDLPGGSQSALRKSLELLKKMPKSARILPGHGPESTIEEELKTNPYLNGSI